MGEDREEHYRRVGNIERRHRMRSLQSSEIQSFLHGINLNQYINPNARVLEIGCGAGNVLADIKSEFGAECYGIDKFPIHVERNKGINVMQADAENIPVEDNFFDLIFSYFAFPYIPDKLRALSEAYRVLKPNGTAIIDLDALFVNMQDTSQLIDRAIHPPFDHIMKVHAANKGKVYWDRVNIFTESGNQTRRSRRVFLKKVDEKPLQFPKLKRFVMNSQVGFPIALSYY
jgi:ubiquinone/menaquinone biosynthesis C-methylase UbiE